MYYAFWCKLWRWWSSSFVINLLGVRSTRPVERDNFTITYNLHTFICSLQHSLINVAKVKRYQSESELVIGVRKSNQWSVVSIFFRISRVEVHKCWLVQVLTVQVLTGAVWLLKKLPLHPTHPIYSQQPSGAQKQPNKNLLHTVVSANTQLSLITKHSDVIKTALSQLSFRKSDTHDSKICDVIVASALCILLSVQTHNYPGVQSTQMPLRLHYFSY